MYANTLTWGHGARTFEVFLEPTCPFSVKAFNKLDELLTEAGPDRLTLKICLQSQPWHLFSGVVARCVLAAATLEGGKESAKAVLAEAFANPDLLQAIKWHCKYARQNDIHASPTFMWSVPELVDR